MKINHFSWDTDYRFFTGDNTENKHPRFYTEKKLNKSSVQLANICNKTFDATKSKPNQRHQKHRHYNFH